MKSTRFFPGKLTASLAVIVGIAATLHAAPVVTRENFNELGNAYQKQPVNSALVGLPAGITANFTYNCQLMWSPGVNPAGSAATNNIEVGWTPATPAVTFSKPVVLWSLSAFKKWSNTVSLVGKKNGAMVWTYTNSDPAFNAWFAVIAGRGKPIDELDINSDSWGAKFTDFCLSDASGISPYTNTSPYYIDGTNSLASDYNPGTQALPWKTLQWAATCLQPGDTVYIKAATYSGDVFPAASGTSNAWITYSAYPGQEQQAVLNQAGIYINQKSYIKISGLKIQHADTGIFVTGPGGNYIISSNYTFDTFSSGIAVWGVPWQSDPGLYNYRAITNVLINNNTIEASCNGGWNEQLDIANGVDSFEVCGNILKNGTNAINGGEGIDCKEGTSNGKIWGNHVFNIRRYAIYLDAGNSDPAYYKIQPGLMTNVQVYNNQINNNDSAGICVSSEGRGNMDGIKVYNNLCYSNGADGIILYHYPNTVNYAKNISIVNNTTYNNNTSTTLPYYGGIATDHDTAQNVIVRNNAVYETLHGAFAIKQPWNPATVMDHNIAGTSNPGFANVAAGIFYLKSNSPAIDVGSPVGAPLFDFDGSARPYGRGFDAGAFEYYPSTPSLKIQRAPGQPSAMLNLQGGPKSHYRVDWTPALTNGTWGPLLEIASLPCSPYSLSDTNVSGAPQRFYRAVLLVP